MNPAVKIIILLSPLVLILLTGNFFIQFLKNRMMGQFIREDGPQSHHQKAGTPTMGGLLILDGLITALIITFFLASSYITPQVGIIVLVTLIVGALGFYDDYQKIAKRHNKGVTGYTKLAVQALAGILVGLYVMTVHDRTSIDLFGQGQFDLGLAYPLLTALIITGTSNAVNLTDGLDGLAGGCLIISFVTMTLILSAADLTLVSWLLAISCLGFLFFNRHPARIFMGDVGSLTLGAILGTIAVLGRLELWLILIGGIYVVETISVILQVASFKSTGKRIFKMAPIHHHFELSGLHETKVVLLFYIIQILFSATAVFLYTHPEFLGGIL